MPCGKQGLLDSEERDLGHGSHVVPGSLINIEESQQIATDRKLHSWKNNVLGHEIISWYTSISLGCFET